MTYVHSLGSVMLAFVITGCSTAGMPETFGGTTTGATGTGGGTSSTGGTSTSSTGAISTSSTGGTGGSGGVGTGGIGGGGFTFPASMALDDHDVVLAVGSAMPGGTGALIRTTPGGGPITVLAGGTAALSVGGSLVDDPQNFDFSALTPLGTGTVSTLFSLARSGGAPVKLADTPGSVLGLAVDAVNLYWAEVPAGGGSGTINAVPIAGGTPVVLASNQLVTGAISVYGSNVYWGTFASDPSAPTGSILSAPLAGGIPTTLATGQKSPMRLRVDESTVVWLDVGTPGVDCAPTDGQVVALPLGGQPIVLASNIAGATGLRVVGGTAYFSFTGPGCNGGGNPTGIVAKVSEAGGAVTDLAMTHMANPGQMVADGTNLYYTTTAWKSGDGAVLITSS